MKLKTISLLILVSLAFNACKETGTTMRSVSGSKYEVLVVMDKQQWDGYSGRAMIEVLDQDTPGLPQAEPALKLIQCNHRDFSDFLKPSRNILVTEISDKYIQPKITYIKNRWAQPQALAVVVAPDEASFIQTMNEYGNNILEYFVLSERERQMEYNKTSYNAKAKAELEELLGVQVDVPYEMNQWTKKDNFFWATNNHHRKRIDLVVYTYPYTDANTFTKEYLIAKRDSVMKQHVSGEFEGSYIATETEFYDPIFEEMNVNNSYAVMLRGLWKMKNGGSMGGPFYSITRLDEENKRIVTVEGFVFAPGEKKRNPIRLMEAVVHSTKLPLEINQLDEVYVTAKKTDEKGEQIQ
jgi:hypothetical protein